MLVYCWVRLMEVTALCRRWLIEVVRLYCLDGCVMSVMNSSGRCSDSHG